MQANIFRSVALSIALAGACCGAGIADKPVRVLYLGDSVSDFDRGSNHVDRLQSKLDAVSPRMVSIYNYSIRGAAKAMKLPEQRQAEISQAGDIVSLSVPPGGIAAVVAPAGTDK